MLTFLKTIFRRPPSAAHEQAPAPARPMAPPATNAAAPATAPVTQRMPAEAPAHAAPATAAPQLAVARLSLLPILQRLPADVRSKVAKMPDASVTVALPLSTIQKQLATGSVKMSLASLYRQSPAGTFAATRLEEKRMIEIPLAEVLRHVEPQALRRRDQRRVEIPDEAPALFGDRQNPYAVSPAEEAPAPPAQTLQPPMTMAPEEVVEISMEAEEEEETPAASAAPAPLPPPQEFAFRTVARPTAAPSPAPVSRHSGDEGDAIGGSLEFAAEQLGAAWPENLREELAREPRAKFVIPAAALKAMLSAGRVIFAWGQLRSWLTPPAVNGSCLDLDTELMLPLKVVAPAFLAHSRPKVSRKTADFDESIPAMFAGRGRTEEAPSEPITEAGSAADEAESEAGAEYETASPVAEIPAANTTPEMPDEAKFETPSFKLVGRATEEVSTAVAPSEEEAAEVAPEPGAPEEEAFKATGVDAAPAPMTPATLGEWFGQPGKTSWNPQELVEETMKLEGVVGAIVALQEGLVVASRLPEQMKGDAVAAFLPQMFARLNQYAHEMNLPDVDEILLSTGGSRLQAYRMGELYFAAVGAESATLPAAALSLVAKELRSPERK